MGWLALAALAANRWFSPGGATPGQTVAEGVAAALAAACVALPSLETALADAAPGRGRRAAGAVPGAASLFRVAQPPTLADDVAAELAWASYALLRNANVCTVAVVALPGGKAGRPPTTLLLRGAAPAALATAADPLTSASAAVAPALEAGSGSALARAARGEGGGAPTYLPDAVDGGWGVLPPGAGCALIQPVPARRGGVGDAPPAALLVVAGDRPGALTARDRAWVAALAAKLGGVLG